jgi:hypothetical protein
MRLRARNFVSTLSACLLLQGCFLGAYEDPTLPSDLTGLTPEVPSPTNHWQFAADEIDSRFHEVSVPAAGFAPGILWVAGDRLESDGSRSARLWTLDAATHTLTSRFAEQRVPGEDSIARRALALSGTQWLLAGHGQSGGVSAATLWRTSDAGTTWTLLSTFQLDPAHATETRDLRLDAGGRVLWLLDARDAAGHSHALLRASADGGASFTTLSDSQVEAGGHTRPTQLLLPATGRILVIGDAESAGSRHAWLRTSADAGGTWTESLFQEQAGQEARWDSLTAGVDASHWILCGSTSNGATRAALLRSSNDAGNTWSVLATDRAASGDTRCGFVAFDATNSRPLFGSNRGGTPALATLKSVGDSGTSPQILDAFRLPSLGGSQGAGLLPSPLTPGAHWSWGAITDESGREHGVIRRFAVF